MRMNQLVSYIWKWITFTYSLLVIDHHSCFSLKDNIYFYGILDLNRILQEKLDKEIPVITVVAVTGTTEQGAVDPVTAVVYSREKFRMKVRITWSISDFISEISYTVKTIVLIIIIIIIIIIIMIIIISFFIVITKIINRFRRCINYIDPFYLAPLS